MSTVRMSTCGEPGPYGAHCTDIPMHEYACYDSGDDVSFTTRQDFEHDCEDPRCGNQHFTNEGD